MTNIYDAAKKIRKNPQNILSNIIYRWSPRSMDAKILPENILMPLFEAAQYAPSAFNAQPETFFYAQKGSKSFSRMIDLLFPANQEWCKNASFLIVLVSKKGFEHNGKFNQTHSFDTGAAWEAFAVEGAKRNLVIHAMSGFDYGKTKEYLKLDDDFQVECMIAVGQPTKEISNEKISLRKDIKQIAIKVADLK